MFVSKTSTMSPCFNWRLPEALVRSEACLSEASTVLSMVFVATAAPKAIAVPLEAGLELPVK